MNYCYLDKECKLEYKSQGEKLVEYYNSHIEKIGKILGVDSCDIPKEIVIVLMKGNGAGYCREKNKIEYRFQCKENILEDKGKLIHEATHVVQNYSGRINRDHPCWCWMEGIADYCRNKLDKNFNIDKGLNGDPMSGYKENAHFLTWLSKRYTDVIPSLNKIMKTSANSFLNEYAILDKLIEDDTETDKWVLLKQYHEEN